MEKEALLESSPPSYDDVSMLIPDQKLQDTSHKPKARCHYILPCALLTLIVVFGALYGLYYTRLVHRFSTKDPLNTAVIVKVFYPQQVVEVDYVVPSDISQSPANLSSQPPDTKQQNPVTRSCTVVSTPKVDCLPSKGSSKEKCMAKGCCWTPVADSRQQTADSQSDTPWCYYPKDESVGYKLDEIHVTHVGYEALYSRKDKSIWPEDVMSIEMDVYEETESRLHFKIYDRTKARYEVPIDTPPVNPATRPARTNYKVDIAKDVFGLKISRADSTGTALFDTTGTKLTFADQYIQITTSLPTTYIYGLGEHRNRLLHNVSKGFTMATWARDQPPAGCVNCNLYGQHPFFIGLEEKTGTAYGVFLLNSNAMEISAIPAVGTLPAQLTYKTIGGILDFYVFTGPSPAEVVQQYLNVIGLPYLPPYWGLGFHLCRWGYLSTDHMKAVIKRMRDQGFPYDTQWNDIDYMHKWYDWTYDQTKYADLPAVVDDLHNNGQHYIMIVDPGIANVTGYAPYEEGVKEGVFIKHGDSDKPLIGKVWPGTTAFPDFFNEATKKWWLKLATQYHHTIPFDGMWTDMNEPSSFVQGSTEGCPGNKYDIPYYTPSVVDNSLSQHTICPSARHHNGLHYNLHSLYGHSELVASQAVLHEIRPGRRTIVISRSTFPSSGKYAGHWTGDNAATWDDLRYSIPGVLNFQFFGIPFVGADICGFQGVTNGELCVRWTQLGVFYPFMRNHNTLGNPDQDPAADMFDKDEKAAMLSALRLRYTLLPYLYTLMAHAHVNGTTVARPLWFEYPNDVAVYGNDKQLMWGESIMVTPVLDKGATSVDAYFPADIWVEYDTGAVTKSAGEQLMVDAPLNKIPVFVRAGGIIPLQAADVTTTKSRKNPFALYVVLDGKDEAGGNLYWDDGDTLNTTESGQYNMIYFTVKAKHLSSSVTKAGYSGAMKLDTVYLNNVQQPLTSATVNGAAALVQHTNKASYELKFSAVDLTKSLDIVWK